jgi:hypothetical protein
MVDCDGVTCGAGEVCCFYFPPRETCTDSATCLGTGGFLRLCDDEADCPPGQHCCYTPGLSEATTCETACTAATVCGVAAECPDGWPYCCPRAARFFSTCEPAPC